MSPRSLSSGCCNKADAVHCNHSPSAELPGAAFAPISAEMAIQIRTSLAEPETAETFVPHKPARPDKAEGGKAFKLVADYEPAGDQPQAIAELVEAAGNGEVSQVLLGVTGSGKTF